MRDAETNEPVRALPGDPRGGGIIDVVAEQVAPLLHALQARGVRCWQAGGFITLTGRPPRGTVVFTMNEKPARVQEILDSLP